MSGNMSFLNNNVRNASTAQEEVTHGNISAGNNGDQQVMSSRWSRGSESFRNGSSVLNSFAEEEEEPRLELEDICDEDVWGSRILLSALADVVFSEIPHPKLSPGVIQGLQKFLLSVGVATSACNPFVEHGKLLDTTTELDEQDPNISCVSSRSNRRNSIVPKLELPKELVEGLTPECKVVLKSLIGTYIRKQMGKIREFWKPILEMNGTTVPELPESSSLSASQRRSVGTAAAGPLSNAWEELCNLICKEAESIIYKSLEVDRESEGLLKKRNEEMRKCQRDMNTLKDIMLESLKELKAQENPEFLQKYMDYLELETENVNQQIRLEKLRILKEEQGSEDEQKERHYIYNQVKTKYDAMLKATEEIEERLQKYKSLGPQYEKLLEEYINVDEDVKLKEWVVEQLRNGPNDESLFSDSFTE